MKAILKSAKISPKKASLIAWMVRWMDAWKAVTSLKFLDKKWAKIIYKLLNSAISNATNNFSQKKWDLYLKKIFVTPWATLKRWRSRSKWRIFSILKRSSHINIELSVKNISEWKWTEIEEIDNKNS